MEYKSTLTRKALETRSVRKLLLSSVVIVILIALGLAKDSAIMFGIGFFLIPLDIGWFIYAYAHESDMDLKAARDNLRSNLVAKYHVEDVNYTIKNKTVSPNKADAQGVEILKNGKRKPYTLTQNLETFEPFLHDANSGQELQ